MSALFRLCEERSTSLQARRHNSDLLNASLKMFHEFLNSYKNLDCFPSLATTQTQNLETIIQLALQEDLGCPFLDITTETLFPEQNNITAAKIISKQKEPCVFAGAILLPALMQAFNKTFKYELLVQDGDVIQPGQAILHLTGSVKSLLMLERTLLNFLQHLCGIATSTKKYVDKIKHTALKILDTRKTTPGFRMLDKYAVFCGGGVNHRIGLYDALLIKDNHIDALGGITNVLAKLPNIPSYFTVIEIRTRRELEVVLNAGLTKINRVLLDNMTLEELTECATLCKNKIATEASGNININNILSIAKTGVDFASIGALTHSFEHIDLSMQIAK